MLPLCVSQGQSQVLGEREQKKRGREREEYIEKEKKGLRNRDVPKGGG